MILLGGIIYGLMLAVLPILLVGIIERMRRKR